MSGLMFASGTSTSRRSRAARVPPSRIRLIASGALHDFAILLLDYRQCSASALWGQLLKRVGYPGHAGYGVMKRLGLFGLRHSISEPSPLTLREGN